MGGNYQVLVMNPVSIQLKGQKKFKLGCSLYVMAFSSNTAIPLIFMCLHYVYIPFLSRITLSQEVLSKILWISIYAAYLFIFVIYTLYSHTVSITQIYSIYTSF